MMSVKDRKQAIHNLTATIDSASLWINRLTLVKNDLALGEGVEPLYRAVVDGEGDPQWQMNIRHAGIGPENVNARYALDAAKRDQRLQGWDGRGINVLTAARELAIDRRSVLQASLPTAEELARAQAQIDDLATDLRALTESCDSRADTIMDLLREAITFARELHNGREQQKEMRDTIDKLCARFDIQRPTSCTVWQADDNGKGCDLLARSISDLVRYGETDTTHTARKYEAKPKVKDAA